MKWMCSWLWLLVYGVALFVIQFLFFPFPSALLSFIMNPSKQTNRTKIVLQVTWNGCQCVDGYGALFMMFALFVIQFLFFSFLSQRLASVYRVYRWLRHWNRNVHRLLNCRFLYQHQPLVRANRAVIDVFMVMVLFMVLDFFVIQFLRFVFLGA